MRVIRAQAMGFCFGVRDALAVAQAIDDKHSVTIHGELVHNAGVLAGLREAGFRVADEAERARLDERPQVLITAHGVSDVERARLLAAGKTIVDSTCPLVRRAHAAAQRMAAEGRHVVVLGRPGHVEVQGLIEDLPSCDVVPSAAEVRRYANERIGVVCQTTTPPRQAAAIVAEIRAQNPHADVQLADTICQPTRDRQAAVETLLDQVDAMVVVGGRKSNNTRELVALGRERGKPVWHVEKAAEIEPQWFAGCDVLGLSAGTSTPDAVIDEVYERLCELAPSRSRKPSSSADWLAYFTRNAAALRPSPWHSGVELSAAEREAVSQSVATFQLGETGGGTHLTAAAARYAAASGDHDYLAAVRLFIAEEQRHGRELGRWLDLAGIPRIERHWSNGAFRRLRQLAGLELMISFLLAAEVLAKVYYAALRKATRSVVLRALCEQILKDEVAHIRFQSRRLALLRAGRSRLGLSLAAALHCLLYAATAIVVWQTHRRALVAGGLHFRAFCRKTAFEARIALRLMEPGSFTPTCQTVSSTDAATRRALRR